MFKKIALLLGLMTSMLFSLTAQATDATDPMPWWIRRPSRPSPA